MAHWEQLYESVGSQLTDASTRIQDQRVAFQDAAKQLQSQLQVRPSICEVRRLQPGACIRLSDPCTLCSRSRFAETGSLWSFAVRRHSLHSCSRRRQAAVELRAASVVQARACSMRHRQRRSCSRPCAHSAATRCAAAPTHAHACNSAHTLPPNPTSACHQHVCHVRQAMHPAHPAVAMQPLSWPHAHHPQAFDHGSASHAEVADALPARRRTNPFEHGDMQGGKVLRRMTGDASRALQSALHAGA